MAMVNINLELYKFLQDEDMRRDGEKSVTVWISLCKLDELSEILGDEIFDSYLEEGGIDCKLQQYCLAFDIWSILQKQGGVELYKDIISDWESY